MLKLSFFRLLDCLSKNIKILSMWPKIINSFYEKWFVKKIIIWKNLLKKVGQNNYFLDFKIVFLKI